MLDDPLGAVCQINLEMEKLLNNTKRAGFCRTLTCTVAALAVVLVLFITPLHARGLSGDFEPVIKRAIDAGIDAGRIERLVDRAQSREVSPDQLQHILNPVISLAEMDFPYHLMMHKAAEGLAKQVPAPGIRFVLDQMQTSMVRSAAVIDPWIGRQEVQHLIEAGRGARASDAASKHYRDKFLESTSHFLQKDADDVILREFLNEVSSTVILKNGDLASIAAGLQVLYEMPMTQDNPGLSVRLLTGAMNAGFTASEIRKLPDALRSAHIHSHLPMEKIAGSMDQQLHDNVPAVHIMENFFQGNVGGGPPGLSMPGLDTDGDGHADHGRGRRPPAPPVP